MTILQRSTFLLSALAIAGMMVACFGSSVSRPNEIIGWYDRMALPTSKEAADLQEFAQSQGVDLDAILKELPESDQQSWKKVFWLATRFTQFDRRAQVYGYRLFTAFSYFIDGAGVAKFARLIDAQPPKVRQCIRDFIYYEAVNVDRDVMKNNERLLRHKLNEIFPDDYSFAADDPMFESFRQK